MGSGNVKNRCAFRITLNENGLYHSTSLVSSSYSAICTAGNLRLWGSAIYASVARQAHRLRCVALICCLLGTAPVLLLTIDPHFPIWLSYASPFCPVVATLSQNHHEHISVFANTLSSTVVLGHCHNSTSLHSATSGAAQFVCLDLFETAPTSTQLVITLHNDKPAFPQVLTNA